MKISFDKKSMSIFVEIDDIDLVVAEGPNALSRFFDKVESFFKHHNIKAVFSSLRSEHERREKIRITLQTGLPEPKIKALLDDLSGKG